MMRALYDINMLLALSDVRHPHHQRAQAWRLAHGTEAGWATCPITQNGFLRISSQSGYSNPIPLPVALQVLSRLTARPDHAFWADDLSLLDPSTFDHSRVLSHKKLTDVYLLAMAVKHGGRLVTLDTGISHKAARNAAPDQLVVV